MALVNESPPKVALVVPTRTLLKVIIFVLGAWVVVDVGQRIASALLLMAVAALLAIALDRPVRYLERRGLGRLLASISVCTLLIVILAGMITAFAAPLASQSARLASRAPHARQDLLRHHWIAKLDHKTHALDKAATFAQGLPARAAGDWGQILQTFAQGLVGALTLIFLTAFLLIEGPQLVRGSRILWPQLAERRWWSLLNEAYTTIGSYVTGTMLVALIDGIIVLILLVATGTPYVLPLALWALVWAVLPIIGGFIGSVPAVLVAFTGGVVPGIIVLVGATVYHVIVRAILHPAIVGRAIEMSAFFVFLAIVLGDDVLGLVGILLAVPLAAIIQLAIADALKERDTRANQEQQMLHMAELAAPPPGVVGRELTN
jgi:predicted PurR-regulated permease PerM